MSTLLRIALTCPVCSKSFESHTVPTPQKPGRKRTDFHEQPVGVQPLPYLVHTCSHCGYTGTERDFGGETRLNPMTAIRVCDELTPKVATGPIHGSDKYEFAAKVAEWQGAEPWEIGELLLRAAWCCVDEDDIEAERYFRRMAAWAFEAALARWDGVERETRAVFTYLVGELWRRVGDTKAATEWFDRVPDEIVAPVRQRWILEAARQQRDEPREWFTS